MAKSHTSRGSLFPGEAEFAVKPRKSIPHEFVLDALSSLEIRTRPMFGCIAIYAMSQQRRDSQERIVLVLRDKPTHAEDNGVWLATMVEHHESLRREFPNMRSVGVLGKKVTGWQILPVDAPDFEAAVLRACELIAASDPRIGKVPGAKKRAGSKGKGTVRRGRKARQ
jgi:hypothetical protein